MDWDRTSQNAVWAKFGTDLDTNLVAPACRKVGKGPSTGREYTQYARCGARRPGLQSGRRSERQAAWYRKRHPTFADALAVVRKELWAGATFYGSPAQRDTIKVPRAFVERLTEAVCYAA